MSHLSCHFRNQIKIRDAYQMLKKQGVVTTDPSFDNSLIMHVPPPRDESNSIFNDEEKKQQLQKLLKSQKPEDLEAANRLIKSIVQAEEAKMEKMKKRNEVLEETQNNVTLLEEMLSCFKTGSTSSEAMQTMKELYDSCVKLRPTLFRLASDTDDSETALMDILRANDDVSRIIQTFEKIVSPHLSSTVQKTENTNAPASSSEVSISENIINDLQLLSLTSDNDTSLLTSFSNTLSPTKPSNNLLDSDNLLMQPTKSVDDHILPFSEIVSAPTTTSTKPKKEATFSDIDKLSSDIIEMSLGRKPEKKFQPTNVKRSLKELQEENKQKKIQTNVALQQQQQATTTRILAGEQPTTSATLVLTDVVKPATGLSDLLLLGNASNGSNISLLNSDTTDIWKIEPKRSEVLSLDDVYVSLDSIRPSTISPLIVYDDDNVRVLIHFAKDHAKPTRTDTLVAVVSIMSTKTQILTDISFRAAAPKVMRLKLQTPSSTQLSAYNPIIAPSPITQVLIISNPAFKEVKIRYKLEYKTSLEPQLKSHC